MADPTVNIPDEVQYSVEGGVARVTINRPDRHNSMSYAVMHGLRASMVAARADDAVRVVVLSGAGERAFCAGADLGGIGENPSAAEVHDSRGMLADLFRDMWGLGKPTVAKVRGYALAGGFGLALACDFVIAADDAQFGTPEIDRGLWPYMITVPLLRSMPPKKALDLMLTGRRVDAAEADRIGFVTRVVAVAELDAVVDELCATLVDKPPVITRWGRDAFYRVLDMSADDALAYLQPMLSVTTYTEDTAEGIAAFLEKRKPQWKGR
ncbi:MAG TPA: enoyl-CoA hydratase-related protein [Acidimicrobiia bacterium]|nr:enoyl-CoA hydratase-related protein [Acidimicrobiia bacterium]